MQRRPLDNFAIVLPMSVSRSSFLRPYALLAVVLVGLVRSLLAPTASAAAPPPRPLVVSTNTILDDLVRTLGADVIDTRCLLTPGRDPHSFDPTPADVRLL